jgi:serine/threonine protein kinase
MHTHNIIHRDLKAENILSHNGVYKIADLGFSKQVGNEEVKQTTLGTITTMAPEVMRKEAYGLKVCFRDIQADIWSVGIIFFQMIFGKVPYTSTNATQMYSEIQTKKILDTEQF